MKINWKVRFKNLNFWVAIIPLVLVLAQRILGLVGITFVVDALGAELVVIVELIFVILGLLGIVEDPTTKGLSDSTQALGYEEPREEEL